MASLKPSELALPSAVLGAIPPRPPGFGMHRELFPRNTGSAFDAITPAVVAADLVMGELLDPARAARLINQRALDPTLPGLETVIDRLRDATLRKQARSAYEREIVRAMEHVLVEHLMTLASTASMPQARAIASYKLKAMMTEMGTRGIAGRDAPMPRRRWPTRATWPTRSSGSWNGRRPPAQRLAVPDAPPGAPIGQPAMEWLKRTLGECSGGY